MKKTEAAWLAGFIDGEGTLRTAPLLGKYIQGHLYIYNTHRGSLAYARTLIGGHISRTNRPTKKHKEGLKLAVYGRKMEYALSHVEPFLRIKKKQAHLLLRLLALQKKSTRSFRDARAQHAIHRRLLKLNRKGPASSQ